MRHLILFTLALVFCVGCGDGMVAIKGKLTKGGQPLVGRVHMVFLPVTNDGEHPVNSYSATVRKDGSYEVMGKKRTGIPPGEYRIALTVMERPEVLQGRYDKETSTIVRTVSGKSSNQTIDIELDHPEG